jgi:hypothetical protein
VTASGTPSSGPRDVIGSFTSEADAQSALARLIAAASQTATQSSRAA